jgi:hypothetical protein
MSFMRPATHDATKRSLFCRASRHVVTALLLTATNPVRHFPAMPVRILALCLVFLGLWAAPARADELAEARAFIARQVEQIKNGDVTALRAGFTRRLRDRITDAAVKKAREGELRSLALDELVASVASRDGGLKIKMKNGRTLTTLLREDGRWAADTLWFK